MVGVKTGYKRGHASEEYFQNICRLASKLDEDLAVFILKGIPVSQTSRKMIAQLEKLACS